MSQKQIKRARKAAKLLGLSLPKRSGAHNTPSSNNYKLTRPTGLRKYEKKNGMKYLRADWIPPADYDASVQVLHMMKAQAQAEASQALAVVFNESNKVVSVSPNK